MGIDMISIKIWIQIILQVVVFDTGDQYVTNLSGRNCYYIHIINIIVHYVLFGGVWGEALLN